MGYRDYLPGAIRSYAVQVAQISTLLGLALSLVVVIGCTTDTLSRIYFIQFLASDQRTDKSLSYEWTRVGVSGQCVYSQLHSQNSCDSRRHPYYFEPRAVVNMPIDESFQKFSQRAGIAAAVMYTFGVASLAMTLLAGTSSLVYHKLAWVTKAVAAVFSVLGALTLTAATALLTAMYQLLHNRLNQYDGATSDSQKSKLLHPDSRFDMNNPGRFQSSLGGTAMAMAWISVVASIIAATLWVRVWLKQEAPDRHQEKVADAGYGYYHQKFYHENQF